MVSDRGSMERKSPWLREWISLQLQVFEGWFCDLLQIVEEQEAYICVLPNLFFNLWWNICLTLLPVWNLISLSKKPCVILVCSLLYMNRKPEKESALLFCEKVKCFCFPFFSKTSTYWIKLGWNAPFQLFLWLSASESEHSSNLCLHSVQFDDCSPV